MTQLLPVSVSGVSTDCTRFSKAGARQQPGRRVVRIQQDVGDAAREQLDDAHLAQVEVGCVSPA